MADTANPLIAALQPLVRRVRTDVTAIKRSDGSRWRDREPLTTERLAAHLNGGPARGVCPIKAGESVTMVGLLDFDSHKGEVSWAEMSAVVGAVVDTLEMAWGMHPILFRSSGGNGVHLYLLWDAPQDAYSVRVWLRGVLESVGLSSGTKGVLERQVEIFPKQDEVAPDGFGNQFILPLAGRSEWLTWDGLAGWLSSTDRALTSGDWLSSPAVPQHERPPRQPRGDRPVGTWVSALDALLNGLDGSADLSYDDWRNVVFAIHQETGGSDEGLAMAQEWSARSPKHDEAFLEARVWPYIKSGGGITGGTIMSLAARLHGWTEPLSGDDFDVVQEARYGRSVVGGQTGVAVGYRGVVRDHAGGPVAPAGATGAGVEPAAAGTPAARAIAAAAALAPVERRGVPAAQHLCTDQANANRLVKAYGSRVLVAAGKWHAWDGVRWRCDEADIYRYACRLSQIVKDEAKAALAKARSSSLAGQAAELAGLSEDEAAEMLAQGGDGGGAGGVGGAGVSDKAAAIAEALEKWSLKCEMKGTIEAAIGLARKMLEVDADLLDRDPMLLNCRNGVVDLRTGQLREHRADDYITKLADVEYVGCGREAWSPRWVDAVAQITGESRVDESQRHVASFLQRWFGYCATGAVHEQVFVVHWGDGSNGKSTVMGTMARVLGDYAGTAAPGLMASSDRSERHPTEIAGLLGKRMVTAHETREGVQLREDFVKQATGDDKITARFMREDFFEFTPTHKLQLLTNAKPVIRGQDHGIWRRVNLVAYTQRFGTAEEVAAGTATALKDMGLAAALATEEELSGVLAWVVAGAVEWLRDGGLRAPAAVLEASLAYRHEQDRVREWVSECCEVGEGMTDYVTVGMGGLYPSYTGWCKDAGYHGLARGRFLHELQRVVPGFRTEETKFTPEGGSRRKVLRVHGVRLVPEG